MSSTVYDADSLPDLLPLYYKKIFPYGPYYRWMNYGGISKTYYTQREFSFTLKDDVYIRYLSYADQSEFEKDMQKKCPYKIDIGAVFTHKPKDHKTVNASSFQAVEKELVFDIDMTDYDDVRNCCAGADICVKCWPLMSIAVKIIDVALRDDFGFVHILWVYSGRRGVHCWVCDESARKLNQNARSAITDYLTLVKGGESREKKVTLSSTHLHPSVQRALDIIDEDFQSYAIKKQNFLSTDEQFKQVLNLIPDENIRKDAINFLSKYDDNKLNSLNRWETLVKAVEIKLKAGEMADSKKLSHVLEEIKLQYCYPRLDVNVTKSVNHLLKSPFCVHPKTGRVCVPMDPQAIDDFDPFTVPTISQLCDELDERKSGDDVEGIKKKDYKYTSLKDSFAVFEKFLGGLEKSWKGKLILESDKTCEF